MKKTYKAPKYKTIDLTGEAMIAGSGEDSINAYGTDEDALVKENVTKQGGSLWDDEW